VLANLRVRSPVVVAVLAFAVLLSGCSLLRPKKTADTTYAESPVDQLYAAGAAKLDHHLWTEGISYFKEVERQHPYSEWSRRAIMMQAFAHYEANQYDDAIADANRFIELYPGNVSTSYAYYLKAECYFEQILDVGRDQAATSQALSAMRDVERRYPKTEYAQDARLKIDMINDQLAGKEMSVGRFYLRRGDTLAAIGRFKTVIDRYQTTSDAPEALYRLVEAYLTIGALDEARRNAAVLGYNFPGDIWYADAYKLMTERGLRPEVEPKPANGFFHRAARVLTLKSAHGSAPPPPSDVGAAPDSPLTRPDASASPAPSSDTPAPAKPQKKGWFDWMHGHKTDSSAPAAPAPQSQAAPADKATATASADSTDSSDQTPKKKKKGWLHLPSFGKKSDSDAPPAASSAPAG
jgi:outer membrane protein assembly factor BamD